MALTTGTKLGPYEIIAPLGAGGMGEVYRARDTRLHREVAFKILSGDSVDNPERQRRFTQEARAASALNHPNILSVYDVGSENGTQYIVSEFIDGDSLRKLIQKGPVPIKKLLDIAVQIADGLAAAHQAGIVHRDMKPENIMITREGRLKILDFGLAKPSVAKLGSTEAETASAPITESGIIVGTVKYMSPEQASGQAADFRSDQFSFGLILYEMATGKQAFERNAPVQILSAIISEEPLSISTLNPKVPAPVRWLIERCLQKDPHNRYVSTVDLHHELRNLRDHITETTSADVVATVPPKRSITKGATALLAVIGGCLIVVSQFPRNASLVDLSSYKYTPFAAAEGIEAFPSWSHDGKSIAYSAEVHGFLQIFTRSLDSPTPSQITKDPIHHWAPFWSPDGSRLFYYDNKNGDLRAVSAAGGSSELILEGGITAADISPDGKTLAFLRFEADDFISLWTSSSSGENHKKIVKSDVLKGVAGFVRFAKDGSELGIWNWSHSAKSEFWIVPFPNGQPQKVLSAISHIHFRRPFDWHPDGKHIVFQGFEPGEKGMHILEGDLTKNSIRPITVTYGNEFHPSISPDGQKIAFTQSESHSDLVEIPLDGSSFRTLLATSSSEYSPSWSPSGNQFVYGTDQGNRSEIWLKNIKEGWVRPVVRTKDIESNLPWEFSEPAFSPDGLRVAYQGRQPGGQQIIWLSYISGGPPIPLTNAGVTQDYPTWSPDGEWIAHLSRISGTRVLAKTKIGGNREQIKIYENVEHTRPQWSPSGDWISFLTTDGLMLVSPDGKSSHKISKETSWLTQGWSKDGSQILGIRATPDGNGYRLLITSIDVLSGKESILSEAGAIPPIGGLTHAPFLDGFSISPDGKSFATSIQRAKADIFLLEGFNKPVGFWERLTGK